ncbi:hypothetical protein [Streptomyces antarcticus]|uniref:hypothetical protein n=1 Tax=Streptomyces antarcticus TaxID=2996458 RepID=UPI002271839B|nr:MULTISPECIES: hypothetical protein [unclassified Streptomyces]MCY0943829.1 hypothetical protein [Streptomyces sp. H34-AA3]MCZ4085713.1 hypothetical protein [Streptomyces sp. H34-S5]
MRRIATGLVRDGLAELRDNPDHRTSPLLVLTGDGQRTLAAVTARATTAHGAMGRGSRRAIWAAVRGVPRRLTRQTDAWADTARAHAGPTGGRAGEDEV